MVRLLMLLLVSISLSFSATVSSSQLELAKKMGYSQSDIDKFTSQNGSIEETSDVDKKQEVENEITKSKNLFDMGEEESNPKVKEDVDNNNYLYEKKKPQEVETEKLKRFGENFFNNENKINPYTIPTPSYYKLNFGDKLKVSIYDSEVRDFDLTINKNGNISIPNVGEIKVIGLTYQEVKKLIEEEAKKAFPASTNILVDLNEYTTIQVTISGFVNTPGLYNLSSFSTIKDALVASGGVLENGSYRNIYLKRDGKVKKVFDLYKLIRYGDVSNDVILQNGDVVLVSPANKEITLSGDTNFNAIFELKQSESFKSLIDFAAGFKPSANKNAIKLKRYENGSLKVYTLDLKKLYSMKPKAGDDIHVYSSSDINGDFVEIKGNIVAEGEREIPKDKKLSTLFENEFKQFGKNGYFKDNTNYSYAAVINDNKIKTFNLKNLLDKKEDITLSNRDKIVIYKLDELQDKPYIYVEGDVVNKENQKYNFYKGMKVSDLFDIVKFDTEKFVNEKNEIAGAVISDTNQDDANLHILALDGKEAKETSSSTNTRIPLMVDKTKVQVTRVENNNKVTLLVNEGNLENFELKPYDEVKFFDFSTTNDENQATIKGEVFIPGTYDISGNTTVNDLISLAGGVTKKALRSRFELTRYKVEKEKRVREVFSLDLDKALKIKFKIFPDDEITIFPIANWNSKMYVELKGLVRFPGKYPIVEGEKLSSVIQRAGGFLSNAFIEGAVFTREEVRLLQQKRIDESLQRLKTSVLQNGLSASSLGEDATQKENMATTVSILEKQVENTKPIGRISLNLYYDLNRFKDSKYDIVLKDKDTLYVPSMNDTISVVGEVLNQNTFVYDDELDVDDYISKAGGINVNADSDYIYVIKANGEAVKHEKRFYWMDSTSVFKGDTIVVPLKLDTISDVAFAKDVTQILYQLAVTAASLNSIGSL